MLRLALRAAGPFMLMITNIVYLPDTKGIPSMVFGSRDNKTSRDRIRFRSIFARDQQIPACLLGLCFRTS